MSTILDIVRIRDALQGVTAEGSLTGAAGDDLFEAVDFLYVRKDTLRKSLGDNPTPVAQKVVDQLETLVQDVDDVLHRNFFDFRAKMPELIQAT